MHRCDDEATTAERTARARTLRVEVLGPLRLVVDGAPVQVKGGRRAAILAMLALAGGRVVPLGTLVEAVWPEKPPQGERQALHSLLSRLRTQLGTAAMRLERDGDGYRLRLHDGELDVADVRSQMAEARAAGEAGDHRRAAAILADALRTWRGPALRDFTGVGALGADAIALSELRLGLEEDQLEAELAAAERPGSDLVERSWALAAAHPMREARQLLHMRVLARVGRPAEALRIGNDYRRRLGEETGLDPSSRLVALEHAIAAGTLAPEQEHRPKGAPEAAGSLPPPSLHPTPALAPRFPTPLLGRDAELSQLRALLVEEHLVAVVGPPGVGKTRLVAEVANGVAAEDPRPLTFVALATVDAATSIAATVAGALGVRVGPSLTPLAAVRERLALDPHVLVLDNCEHVLGAVRDLLAELLATCPGLTVLITSRVPTGLSGECVIRVPPLGDDGVRLFVERATRVRPTFAVGPDDGTIAEIVERLDGLPLAIELAAGRLSTLSLPDLRARLDDALDLLGTSGAASRQRTLRSTLDWSYHLLDEGQRGLLRHLAEFADGVDLSGVEAVAVATGLPLGGTVDLAGLVDASLVDAHLDGEARYRLLETVRALAREHQRDVPGESDRARAVMVDWATRVAAEIDAVSRTPGEPRADRRLRRELRNLRAAHQAALEGGDLDRAISISVSLDMPSGLRDMPEVWSWAQRLVGWHDVEGHHRFVEVLGAAAEAAWLQGDLAGAEALGRRGVAIGGATGRCLHALAAVMLFRGHFDRAFEFWEEAAEQDSVHLGSAALAAVYAGRTDLAAQVQRKAADAARDRGAPSDLAWAHYVLGEMGGRDAVAEYEAAIDFARAAGATFVEGVATVGLAARLAADGAEERALATYDQVVRYWAGTGNWTQQWTTLRNLAILLSRRGDEETAAAIIASADAAAEAAAVVDAVGLPEVAGAPLPRHEVVTRALTAVESLRRR